MRRYEVADEDWERIADLFSPELGDGRPWRGRRSMVNAMLWILTAGSPWRDLPKRYGPWQTAHNRFNRRRKGGTFDLVADSEGTPPAVHVTAGQTHEVAGFEPVVDAVRIPPAWGRPRTRPRRLAGDKGHGVPWVRDALRRRHITPIFPERHKSHGRKPGRALVLDAETYRRRNVIERSISWLTHARRIATRYEKVAVNDLAILKLAMIQRYLRNDLRDAT